MKLLIIIIIFLLFLLMPNCSSLKHTKKDIKDTITMGLETPVYGIGLRLGPFPMGFLFVGKKDPDANTVQANSTGIRGGQIGKYYSTQLIFGLGGGESFFADDLQRDDKGKIQKVKDIPVLNDSRNNLKSYVLKYRDIFDDPPSERQKRKKRAVQKYLIDDLSAGIDKDTLEQYMPKEDPKPKGYPASYLYQFELIVGIYGGIRFGINIAEIADVFTGFFSVDLLEDDMP